MRPSMPGTCRENPLVSLPVVCLSVSQSVSLLQPRTGQQHTLTDTHGGEEGRKKVTWQGTLSKRKKNGMHASTCMANAPHSFLPSSLSLLLSYFSFILLSSSCCTCILPPSPPSPPSSTTTSTSTSLSHSPLRSRQSLLVFTLRPSRLHAFLCPSKLDSTKAKRQKDLPALPRLAALCPACLPPFPVRSSARQCRILSVQDNQTTRQGTLPRFFC